MKEIKLRVWDKLNKQWATDFTLTLDGQLLCDEGRTVFIRKNFELVEYTGLKDANGKEVFVGDIIKFFYLDGWEYVVAKIEYCEEYARFQMIYKGHLVKKIERSLLIVSEVIGNIHENPGLMELINE